MRSFQITYFISEWDYDYEEFYDRNIDTVVHADSVEGMYNEFEYETGESAASIVKVVELDDFLNPVATIYEESIGNE